MPVQLDPANVFGRDRLIQRIWHELKTKSLRFTAERRIGKTTVMKKMEAEPIDGVSIVYVDLEKVDSPQRFTEIVLTAVKPMLSTGSKATQWLQSLIKDLGGTEIGGIVKLPDLSDRWQPPLERALEGICEHNPDVTIVLLLDELPYMLQKISAFEKQAGATSNAALSLLDTLRAAVGDNKNLRMVFAGSVGLHHVLGDLRGRSFASQPVNHMPPVEIGPLEKTDAIELALHCLEQDGVQVVDSDAHAVAEKVATLADCVPFYIERIVARLSQLDEPVFVDVVEHVVLTCLTDDRNEWEMEHYRERLSIYYPDRYPCVDGQQIAGAKVASEILDILALVDTPLSINEVCAAVSSRVALIERENTIQLLRSLTLDHYLVCDTNKRYQWRFPLVQRWWLLAQGLTS